MSFDYSLISAEMWQRLSDEVNAAEKEYGHFASRHEGYAVMLEEVDELWDEIKTKGDRTPEVINEAIQVAASALRLASQVAEQTWIRR